MSEHAVVFYASFYEAMQDLLPGDKAQLFDAIMTYGLNGEILDLPSHLRGLFALMKPNIDASQRRHRASVMNGGKGGRPHKNQTSSQSGNQTSNQSGNQLPNHDKETETEKETDTEKEKENDTDTNMETNNALAAEKEEVYHEGNSKPVTRPTNAVELKRYYEDLNGKWQKERYNYDRNHTHTQH